MLKKMYVHLRKMCFLLLLDGIFYIYHLRLILSVDLSIQVSRVLKSPIYLYICAPILSACMYIFSCYLFLKSVLADISRATLFPFGFHMYGVSFSISFSLCESFSSESFDWKVHV